MSAKSTIESVLQVREATETADQADEDRKCNRACIAGKTGEKISILTIFKSEKVGHA